MVLPSVGACHRRGRSRGACAAVVSSLLFGFGHIYFGVRQVRVSAIGGLFFAAIALAAGSLVPAMIVHAALDWHSFDLGFRALRETGESGAAPAVPAVS